MSLKEVLIDFCESNELEYRTDYSGRGMFGRKCFGVVCDDPLSTAIVLADAIRDTECFNSAYDELGSPRTDSMGLSEILYFPNLCFD